MFILAKSIVCDFVRLYGLFYEYFELVKFLFVELIRLLQLFASACCFVYCHSRTCYVFMFSLSVLIKDF